MVTPRDERADERQRRQEELERANRLLEEARARQVNENNVVGGCVGGEAVAAAVVGEGEIDVEQQEQELQENEQNQGAGQNINNENVDRGNMNPEIPRMRAGQQNFQNRNGGSGYEFPENSGGVGQMEWMMQYMISENRIRNEQIQRRDQTIDILVEQIQGLTQSVLPNARSTPRSQEDTLVTCHMIPDLTKNIEKYDGEGNMVSAHGWLKNIESMCRLHRWSDEYALDVARMNLVGGAKRWLNARADEIKCWAQFKTSFENKFYIKENMSMKWQKMTSRLQRKNETSNTYFHDKYELCRQLKLSFDETKEMILRPCANCVKILVKFDPS